MPFIIILNNRIRVHATIQRNATEGRYNALSKIPKYLYIIVFFISIELDFFVLLCTHKLFAINKLSLLAQKSLIISNFIISTFIKLTIFMVYLST